MRGLAYRVGSTRGIGHPCRFIALAILLGGAPPLWAQAEMVESFPEDGTRLEQAPEELTIRLDEPLRLTLFAVSGPEGMVELGDTTQDTLAERHRAVPAGRMVPGEYRIVWRGTAASGTTSAGGYRFELME
ncbi:copper resistance protein CopC [Halomonas daqingensis]|uniref:Copper resistance protein CopC n=1 Tax=Billgrantia desiderata TaxID=52021 RepID=A0AAW4YZI7_9GAMM|nr:copper resistance CopC family protein [Halomonas desiderata]MCE8042188.1 copper resistance protein CopC [Halomonas desiderata]MCE8046667.1 copper resistance protein CopC [Halomonas desiderata]MCE8053276.1 copper resistance protein CopC [Halomonas desiderata]